MGKPRSQKDVLRYRKEKQHAGTVLKHFLDWRSEQKPPIPCRCDNAECPFHTEELVWNGNPLSLILDHSDGVNSNNSPMNLRLLCPNCNSQLRTHGGGNIGRVVKTSGGYQIKDDNGVMNYYAPIFPATIKVQGMNIDVSITPAPASEAQPGSES